VIEALGAAAIVQRETGGRTYLDVARTAEVLVRQACPRANVYRADINTVTDERFHSYRRARDHAGRGLGFFLVDS
jgi:copper oxidase (laccase) domain-containing protein